MFGWVPLWAWLLMGGLVGGVIGLGGFTFSYGQGYSYLGNDPKACVNCHVMRDVYEAWGHSSHKAVAQCNDCHAPHDLVAKYAVKGLNGFNHSTAFTFGNFQEPLRARSLSRRVLQNNCLHCHRDMVESMSHEGELYPTDCLRCHGRVGHET